MPKVIGGRSREERQFLMDLVEFLAHSETRGEDELFSARVEGEKVFVLTARKVRDLIKQTCVRHGLPPARFSSHSLRKGAISDMRALGMSEWRTGRIAVTMSPDRRRWRPSTTTQ